PLISSVFDTSHLIKTASPLALALSSEARVSPSSCLRAQKMTLAPALANVRTHPSPMPLVPPVMTTTLSRYSILDRRIDQFLRLRRIHVVGRDHHDAGVDAFLNRPTEQAVDHCFDAEFADGERALHNETLHLIVLQSVDERLARIEANKGDFSSLIPALQSEKHPPG